MASLSDKFRDAYQQIYGNPDKEQREAINYLIHHAIIKEYETQRSEIMETVKKIDELITQGTAPNRIAVIYKENSYGKALIKYLSLGNIPFYSKRSLNILTIPFAKKVINILRYLAAEYDMPYGGDEMLFEILHYDFYNIPPVEIAKIAVEVNNKKHKGELISMRKFLQDKVNTAQTTLFDVNIHKELGDTSNMLEKLIRDVSNVTIQMLFEKISHEAGVLSYILKSNHKILLLQVLTALSGFIKEETKRNPDITLRQLVRAIDLLAANETAVPLMEISGTEKGVKLLTIHDSKGVKYEHIFFVGCNASFWEDRRKPVAGLKLPDTTFLSEEALKEEKLRRLFYVAIIAAEKYLCISYARFKLDGREEKPSIFIAEIVNQNDLAVEKERSNKEPAMELELPRFTNKAPGLKKAQEDFISNLLKKFVMNVTALNNYLRCPIEFYFKNLIRIPSGKSEATEFGSAVHFAIQRLFEKMKTHPAEQFPSKPEMLQDFKWYILRHRQHFAQEAYNWRLEYGEVILNNYYDRYSHTWNKIVAVERNIRNVWVKGIPIRGKLDKLEFNGKEINVVDYKTGDYEKARYKLQSPNDSQPQGGDYWRQAVFYKILVDNYAEKNWKVVSTEFDFVEPDKQMEYHKVRVIILPQDIETVTQQFTSVWQKIQNHDFYTGCGKENCYWCGIIGLRYEV